MRIVKKSDRYTRSSNSYKLAKNEIMGSVFELQEITDFLMNTFELNDWADKNPRCSGAVLILTSEEMASWTRYNQYSRHMPNAAKSIIDTWEIKNKSPYSDSFYNANGIDWNIKPEGHLRISDHWGWERDGESHCQIEDVNGYVQGWKVCKYEGGKYHIVVEF